MNPSHATDVDVFLSRHVSPAPGRATHDAKERILHWIAVANNPAIIAANTNPETIAEVRRKARQNIRRLVKRHPQAAAQIEVTR